MLLAGCTTYFPVNDAVSAVDRDTGYRANRRWSPDRSNDILMILAFSGGGTRAAAFAYGVLEELDAATAPLLEVLGSNPDMWDGGENSRYR